MIFNQNQTELFYVMPHGTKINKNALQETFVRSTKVLIFQIDIIMH